jgi:hypothetical protein
MSAKSRSSVDGDPTAHGLREAEAEIAALRATIKKLESALRAAGAVLAPFVRRSAP